MLKKKKKRRERREGKKLFGNGMPTINRKKNSVRKIPNLLNIVIIIVAIIDGCFSEKARKSQFSSFLPGFRRGSMQSWE